jgi:hypothetical protein
MALEKSITLDTANPFKSAYDYLKTLDEFQGSIDV